MIAAIANIWSLPRLEDVVRVPPEPKPYRAPLFIGDVALPRGHATEFYHQWMRAEADARDEGDDRA